LFCPLYNFKLARFDVKHWLPNILLQRRRRKRYIEPTPSVKVIFSLKTFLNAGQLGPNGSVTGAAMSYKKIRRNLHVRAVS
jgi:hypothetical protein